MPVIAASSSGLRALVRWAPVPFMVSAVCLLAAWRFGSFVTDDMLVGLRYAERFASSRGLTWNDHERVNAISGPLTVFAAAAAYALGLPSLVGGRALAVLGASLTALVLFRAARDKGASPVMATSLAVSTLATAPFAAWVFGGLDGPLVAGLLVFATFVFSSAGVSPRQAAAGTLALVLLSVARVDGVGMAVTLVVAAALVHPSDRRCLLVRVLPWPVLAALVSVALQRWYFGAWFPTTVTLKAGRSWALAEIGSAQVVRFGWVFLPLLLAVLAVLCATRRSYLRPALVPLVVSSVWTCYLLWIGGDWMPAFRHFAPVVALLVLAGIQTAPRSPSRRAVSRGILLTGLVLSTFTSYSAEETRMTASASVWMADCVAGSAVLRDVFRERDPLLAVEPAGCPPLVTGFRSLDMVGLTDWHIARTAPAATATPVTWSHWFRRADDGSWSPPTGVYIPGHAAGDGAYVWNAEPDLFVLCAPEDENGQGCFRSWQEMTAAFVVADRYQLLYVKLPSGSSGAPRLWKAWVRHDGGATGVGYHSDGLTVPSYLFARSGYAALLAGPDPRTVLDAGSETSSPPLTLGPGRYQVRSPVDGVFVRMSGVDRGVSDDACSWFYDDVLLSVQGRCRLQVVLSNGTSGPLPLGDVLVTLID